MMQWHDHIHGNMHGILQIALLACLFPAVEPSMVLEPVNVTVLHGTPVRFNCSTTEFWEVMMWQVSDRMLLTISEEHGPLGCSDNVCAVNHSTQTGSMWELVLNSPRFSPTAQMVVCQLLPFMDQKEDQRQTAYLFVQEKGTVTILGGNISAHEGEVLTLQCQAEGWYPVPTVAWTVNGTTVDSSGFNTSSAQDGTGRFNLTSVLRVKMQGSTWVECLVSVSTLLTPQRSTVSVRIKPPENDRAVVIGVAVTVCTIVLFALLALLFYYTCKSTESKACHEGRRVEEQVDRRHSQREATVGKVNVGFHHDTHSEISGSSWCGGSHLAAGSILKVPNISSTIPHDPLADSRMDYLSIQRIGVPKTVRLTTTV